MIEPAAPQGFSHERRHVMGRRMASFSWPVVAALSVLAAAAPAAAQQSTGQVVKLADGETLTISGFISATLFSDNGLFGSFGQGQNAEWAAAPAAQPATDKTILDPDVRNTRCRL